MYRPWSLLLALFSLGCGADAAPPPHAAPDLATVRQQAQTHIRELMGRLAQASTLLDDSPSKVCICKGGDRLAGALLAPCDEPSDTCETVQLSTLVEDLADFLAERVFVDGNFESEQGDTLVLLLRSEASCDLDDRGCIDLLDRLQLRLRIYAVAEPDGLIIEVQSGPRRPFLLRLFEEELAIEVDLVEVEPLLRTLHELREPAPTQDPRRFDADEPEGLLLHGLERIGEVIDYELLQGRIELMIAAVAGEAVEVQLSILEGIEIVSVDPEGLSLSMEPALPALSLSLDPEGGDLELEANLGSVDLRGPAATLLEREEPLAGRLALHLDGLQGRTSWLAGMSSLLLPIEGFGLGDATSTITLDGAPLVSLDLNPQDGRRVDLQISEDPELGTVLQVVPALELEVGLRLANLADQLQVPSWALDETFRLRLDDAPAPAILFRGGALGEGSAPSELLEGASLPPIEVLAGRLLLESRTTRTVLVPAGMCLRRAETSADLGSKEQESPDHEEAHLLDRLESGVCR